MMLLAMQSFKYPITTRVFENTLYDIMEREGGDWETVTSIKKELGKGRKDSLYERFMALCHKYHITLVPKMSETKAGTLYQLEIHKDGQCWYNATLKEPNEDITEQIATKLYEVVGVSLRNKKFIEATEKANSRDA